MQVNIEVNLVFVKYQAVSSLVFIKNIRNLCKQYMQNRVL